MPTVQEIYDFVDQYAPFDTQMDFDNAGLLTGSMTMAVTGVHLALDCTHKVIDECIATGANVLITHHPLMFSPRKNFREDDFEGSLLCRLARHRIALIAAHTNLDAATSGMGDAMCGLLHLTDVVGDGLLRVGNLPAPMTAEAFVKQAEISLHAVVRLMGDPTKEIHRIGLCTGAGSDFWADALQFGADAYLTGECKHHHALAATNAGMVCFECGHYATEAPGMETLQLALQNHANHVQW